MNSEITTVTVTLKIDGTQALRLMVAADGSIKRAGTGAVGEASGDLFSGLTDSAVFAQVATLVDPVWFERPGTYTVPDSQGPACSLVIRVQTKDGQETGIGFKYGAESKGPPEEIQRFVFAAVKATEPWFQGQKRMVEGSE